MNHTELVKATADRTGETQVTVDAVIRGALEVTAAKLRASEEVTLLGVGKLKTIVKAAHTGRNPRTGAAVAVPAKVKVKFGASSNLVL